MRTMKPLHDRCLVRRVSAEETTKGGLFIPERAKEKPQEGIVIACGDGAIMDNGSVRPMSVKPGDRIMFERYGTTEAKPLGEEDLLLIKEESILGILLDDAVSKAA